MRQLHGDLRIFQNTQNGSRQVKGTIWSSLESFALRRKQIA